MAVATPQVELWRALQVNTDSVDKQKNGWGEDRQKVLQMMLGHFNHHHQKNSATLDLLGLPGSAAHGSDLLELDEEQCLPSGWEKVLDLKTGAVYYVNSATGSRAAVEVGAHGVSKHQMLTCSSGEKPVRSGGGDDDSRNGAGRIGTLDLRLNLWASEDDWNLRTTTIRDAGSRRGSHSVSESSNMSSTVSPSASSSPSSCISSERTSSNDVLCGACAAAAADQAEIAMKNSNGTGFFNNNITLTSAAAAAMVLVGCPRCLMYVILSREDPRCPKCKSSVLLDFPHAESSKRPRTSA